MEKCLPIFDEHPDSFFQVSFSISSLTDFLSSPCLVANVAKSSVDSVGPRSRGDLLLYPWVVCNVVFESHQKAHTISGISIHQSENPSYCSSRSRCRPTSEQTSPHKGFYEKQRLAELVEGKKRQEQQAVHQYGSPNKHVESVE